MRPQAAVPASPGGTVLAALMLILGIQLLPLVDGIAKYLSAVYPVLLLAWGRYVFQLLAVLPVALWRHRGAAIAAAGVRLQVLRGLLLVACTVLFFGAVSSMPLADAIAVVFVYPFLVTTVSALLLGEAVGPRRWAAVVLGFAGVLLIVRPGGGFYPQGTPLALAAGTLFAVYVLLTRRIAGRAPPIVGLCYTAAVGVAVLSVALPWTWRPLSLQTLGLMALMGVLTAFGHGLIMWAYERAPASLLAPLGYLEMVGAVLVGLLLFDDFPDAHTWTGMLVITASGVYLCLRERRGNPGPVNAPPG